jgi:hypothetical protein
VQRPCPPLHADQKKMMETASKLEKLDEIKDETTTTTTRMAIIYV